MVPGFGIAKAKIQQTQFWKSSPLSDWNLSVDRKVQLNNRLWRWCYGLVMDYENGISDDVRLAYASDGVNVDRLNTAWLIKEEGGREKYMIATHWTDW